MKLQILDVGPLYVNCSIFSVNGKCIIFDPGDDFNAIDEYITKNKLKPLYILNTHGHFDHIGAVDELKDKYNIPFYMSKKDEKIMEETAKQAVLFGLPPRKAPKIDRDIKDEDIFEIENIKIKALATPGHTPGGMCFHILNQKIVISGDTLFYLSVGRTDFPYSDFDALVKGIKSKLFTLPDDTVVIPGHGEKTTIGFEKKTNPFLR
ncbi:MAG: metallo-beta-lactamase family protein [Deferribacteraceae bacterium]|jgi:glyoxylase-like metal-dependent hydrolase (beta-lactamase superfamily II)|nr:metallo-beta-lactamase family protein [Deferribacteraceae bacterium]